MDVHVMTNLKEVNIGSNKFCGPAVLSILTGKSTDECAYAITRVNGNYNVQGVTVNDLIKAADGLGFNCIKVNQIGRSLFSVLTSLVNQEGIYIVMIPRHFVCIGVKERQIYFCDNHTKEPIKAESSARLSQSVECLYRVSKKPKPDRVEARFKSIQMLECCYCRARGQFEELIYHNENCSYGKWLKSQEE